MRITALLLLVIFISCNQVEPVKEDIVVQDSIPAKTVPVEDSLTMSLRTAVTAIETEELRQTSTIKYILIDSIRHQMVSLKDYYKTQKEELEKIAHYSTDKQKTTKALAYLDGLAATSSIALKVYKVQFHLNALLGNNTKYNEQHTKYLDEALKEINIVFP